ncbi:MAG: hypothetical protein QNJ97_22685 [Myxococcota bacterium]|nr:hypothetical protein [Myxococcota bacterium]
MSDFIHGALKIVSEEENEARKLSFFGRSDTREPAEVLNPFFNTVLSSGTDHLILDFSKLEFMNSSTISPLVQFMHKLNKRSRKTTITYDASTKWQDVSFRALKKIAEALPYISVES